MASAIRSALSLRPTWPRIQVANSKSAGSGRGLATQFGGQRYQGGGVAGRQGEKGLGPGLTLDRNLDVRHPVTEGLEKPAGFVDRYSAVVVHLGLEQRLDR